MAHLRIRTANNLVEINVVNKVVLFPLRKGGFFLDINNNLAIFSSRMTPMTEAKGGFRQKRGVVKLRSTLCRLIKSDRNTTRFCAQNF